MPRDRQIPKGGAAVGCLGRVPLVAKERVPSNYRVGVVRVVGRLPSVVRRPEVLGPWRTSSGVPCEIMRTICTICWSGPGGVRSHLVAEGREVQAAQDKAGMVAKKAAQEQAATNQAPAQPVPNITRLGTPEQADAA